MTTKNGKKLTDQSPKGTKMPRKAKITPIQPPAEDREFKLPLEQWNAFLEALNKPAVTIPALRKLLRLPSVLETPTPPPAPEPPNPVVLALQEHILGLVNQRTSLQDALVNANAQLRNMQAAAESARERLQTVEGEVQYRFGLIAQLLGKPAQLNVGLDSRAFASIETTMPFSSAPQAGVGSIPPRRAPMAGVVGEARTESAEEIRSML